MEHHRIQPHGESDELHEECKAQCVAFEHKWKRALADLANREKAYVKEREEMTQFATANVFRELLPLVDALHAAAKQMKDGVRLEKMFDGFLRSHGVDRIPFHEEPDFSLHEIVGQRLEATKEPGSILDEVQAGYTMHGKCLRTAKVIVAAEPHHAEEQDPDEDEKLNKA